MLGEIYLLWDKISPYKSKRASLANQATTSPSVQPHNEKLNN